MGRLARMAGVLFAVPVLALSQLAGVNEAAAQSRPDASVTWGSEPPSRPVSTVVPALAVPMDVFPVAQEWRLPVYDDDGEVIPYEEILALVDPSGSRGATWGFILGAVSGLVIGGIIGQCGGVRGGFRYYCSPREESLQTGLPLGLGFTFGMGFGWAGWAGDRTTFDEAVEKIRLQRRLGR